MFSKTSIIVLHLSRLHYRTLVFPPSPLSPPALFSSSILMQFTLKRVISRSFSWSFLSRGREKTPSRRNHSASKTASNTGGTYSCILAEIFFQTNLIVRFFLEKSHFSLLFNFIRVSPGWERLSLRLWLLTTGLRFCDTVDQERDDFFF